MNQLEVPNSDQKGSYKELWNNWNIFTYISEFQKCVLNYGINQCLLRQNFNVSMKLWLSIWNFDCQIKFWVSIWKPRRMSKLCQISWKFPNTMEDIKFKYGKTRFLEKWFESKICWFSRAHENFNIVLENEWVKNHVSLRSLWQFYGLTKLS